MAYNVSSAFREQLYSGESNFRAILTIDGTSIDNDQIASISISSPIIDDSKQVFYVGTFISQKITIHFKDMNNIVVKSGSDVNLSIGQYVNNEWVDVPIGKFIIDDLAEDYYKKSEINCLDYGVKFKPNVDYSPCFTDGKANVRTILEYICEKVGVELGDYPTINDEIEVGTYDSTVSGKQWVSYIAEIKGCNAKIDRTGKLTLQPLKQSSNVPINALESASFETGDSLKITKVTFFDAIRNFTFGDDTNDTLFIRQDNPFVTNEDVINNIYHTICTESISETGKSFDIDDADANSIDIKTIYGETSQETYSGKNLFNLGNTTSSGNAVTYTINGSEIKFNGTTTNNNYIFRDISLGIFSAGTYKYSTQLSSGTLNMNNDELLIYNGSENYVRRNIYVQPYNATFTLSEDTELFCKIWSNRGTSYTNYVVDFQIEEGSVVTPYEQYVGGVPSPNPDYPQDIHNVSGDNDIVVCGKNLLDLSNISWYRNNNSDYSIISDTSTTRVKSSLIEVSGGTYTISGIPSALTMNGGSPYCYDSNKTFLGNGYATFTNNTITLPINVKYIALVFNGTDLTNEIKTTLSNSNMQLEKGNQATPYEAYNSNTYPINLPVENLFNPMIYNTTASHSNCTVDITNTTINVTPTGNSYLGSALKYPQYVNNNNKPTCIEVKPNTKYTFSINNTGNSYITYVDSNYQAINTVDYPLNNLTSYTFTTPTNCKYVMFRLGKNSGTTPYSFENIQLEEGTKVNTYVPYGLVPIGYNLFDKNDLNDLNGFFHTTVDKITSNNGRKTVYIPCKPNTTYTVSILKSSVVTADINRFCIAYTKTIPDINVYVYGVVNNKTNVLTITTGSDAQYLVAYIYNQAYDGSGISYQDIINSLRIEEGTVSHANDHAIELNNISNYQDKIFRNSGKNLFDYTITPFTTSSNLINCITQNSIKLTCGSGSGTTYLFSAYVIKMEEYAGKQMTLSFNLAKSGTNKPNITIFTCDSNRQNRVQIAFVSYTSVGNKKITFSLPEEMTTTNNYICINFYETADTASTEGSYAEYINIQLEEGSTNTEYEPYGNGDWYIAKNVGNHKFIQGETLYKSNNLFYTNIITNMFSNNSMATTKSKYFRGVSVNDRNTSGLNITYYDGTALYFKSDDFSTLDDFKNFIYEKTILYMNKITEYNKITYQPLIDQLNAYASLFEGVNHIVIEANDLIPTIDIDYYKNSNFELTSIKTHNYGDFTLDAWDNIDYDLDGTHYITLNNNTIKYEMSIMGDVDTKIPTKQQQVTTNVIGGDDKTNLKIIKTNVDQLNATVDIISKQQTATETNISQLQLDVNGINTEVERIENVEINGQNGIVSQLATVQQTVNNISNMFQITGGINLIRNSAFLLTDDLWTFTDSGTNPYHTELGNSYNSALSGDTVSVAEIKLRSIDVKSKSENITDLKTDGTRYTFNFYHKQDNNMTTTIKMYSTEDNTVKAFNDIVITGQQPKTNYSVSFIPTFANYTLEIVVTSTASIGYAYIYDMMLNSGETQSWQPASDEIYSTTLSMSRLGLKVYSVGDGTITLLGSDGLLTYETTDGRTLVRLVSSRTVEGDTTRNITTQALYLTRDITIENPDKWVSTIVTINGSPHKVEYIDRGGQ